MSLRYLTPMLALTLTGLLPAAEHPQGERPGPPPAGALFERMDLDHDQQLNRREFVRGMISLHQRRAGAHERPHKPGEGEGRPPRPQGEGEGHPGRPPGGEGKDRSGRPPGKGDGEGRAPRPPSEGEGRPNPEVIGKLEGLFEKADTDKSGSLSIEEFRTALKHLPRQHGHDGGDRERDGAKTGADEAEPKERPHSNKDPGAP